MQQVSLNHNTQYDNYSGLHNTTGVVTTEPRDISSLIGTDEPTWSFNVRFDESFEVVIDDQIIATVPKEITVTAKGKQYNPEIHVMGGNTLINVNFKEGQNNLLFTAANLVGNAPVIRVSANFTPKVKELQLENELVGAEGSF